MPTFIGTTREFNILIDALSQPAGVVKSDRQLAEVLRSRLQKLLGHQPPAKQDFSHIRNSWPDGFVRPDKKSNWSYDKPKANVDLNKSTTQPKVDDILKGLI